MQLVSHGFSCDDREAFVDVLKRVMAQEREDRNAVSRFDAELSPGPHTITVRATDTDDLYDPTSLSITQY